MGNLNQVIVVLHGLAVMAEKMLNEIAMVFLGIEAIVFNAPSSTAVENSQRNIFLCER